MVLSLSGERHRPKRVPCPTSTSQHRLVPRAPLFTRASGDTDSDRRPPCLDTGFGPLCPALLQHLQDWLRGDPDPPGSASGPPLQPVFVMSLSPPGKFCGSSGCLGPLPELALTLHFGKVLLECLLSTNTQSHPGSRRLPSGHPRQAGEQAIRDDAGLEPSLSAVPSRRPRSRGTPWLTVAHRGTLWLTVGHRGTPRLSLQLLTLRLRQGGDRRGLCIP